MRKRNLVFLLFILAIMGCTIAPPQMGKQKVKEGFVTREIGNLVLEGKVYPMKEMIVTSPLSGRIKRIDVKQDDYVDVETPLIHFDTSEIESDLLVSRARLAQARADSEAYKRSYRKGNEAFISQKDTSIKIKEAKAVLNKKSQQLKRMREAYKYNAVSKQELEEVEIEYARAEAELQSALLLTKVLPTEREVVQSYEFTIKEREAEYSRIEDKLRQTVVTAPISGFVDKISIYQGQYVHPGWELLKIVDIKHVKIEAKVNAGLIKFVHPGQKVKVTINTVPLTTVSANINSVRKIANIEDQMCGVVIILPNKDYNFQPGLLAKVEVLKGKGG